VRTKKELLFLSATAAAAPPQIMFVTVRYGSDESALFNPDCSVFHFVEALKRRCCGDLLPAAIEEEATACAQVDLSDESGLLVGIGNACGDERASAICEPHSTYILLERRPMSTELASKQQNVAKLMRRDEEEEKAAKNRLSTEQAKQQRKVRFAAVPQLSKQQQQKKEFDCHLYYPLLNDVYSHYPDYYFHRNKEEKRAYMKKVKELNGSRFSGGHHALSGGNIALKQHRKSLFPTSPSMVVRSRFDHSPTSTRSTSPARSLEVKSNLMGRRLTLI